MAKKEQKPDTSIDDLMAAINAAPDFTQQPKTRSPIGVPDDYSVEGRRSTRVVRSGVGVGVRETVEKIPPRYFEGDEMQPAAWDAPKVAEFQRALAAAGLFPKKAKFRNGVWDELSAAAYRKLLTYANASGMDRDEALAAYGAAGPAGADDEETLTVRTSNPDELRAVFDTVARTKLGRKMPPEWVDGMVAAYQAQETNFQQMVGDNAAMVTEPPSAQTFAATQIEQRDPAGVAANDFGTHANEFFSLLDGPT